MLARTLAPEPFADWLSVTGALLHHRGITPLVYSDLCSAAQCLAVPRPHKVTHLKPHSMQNITLLLPKRKVHYYCPPPLMSTLSQSFDCMSQLKHLMSYLNIADLNEPLSSVRGAPLLKDMTYRLTFKGRNLFERRQNVNRVVSDEEALCFCFCF